MIDEHGGSELTSALGRTLGPRRDDARAIAEILDRAGIGLESLEASVRVRDGARSGARMMIEHVPTKTARALLDSLGAGADELGHRVIAAADAHALPTIVGWDAGTERFLSKVYVNASDASKLVRSRVWLGVADALSRVELSPHVIGVNIGDGESELKVYEQSMDLPADAPSPLRAWTAGLELAGAVRSSMVSGGELVPKAWFVAPVSSEGLLPARLRALIADDDLLAAVPFAPGLIKSVGLSSDARAWTIYVKPRLYDGAVLRLEPEVCVSDGHTELGIYVEPTARARRAYVRTARYAVSYRVREGDPHADEIVALMQWAVGCIEAGERAGTSPILRDPPEPWHVVAAG